MSQEYTLLRIKWKDYNMTHSDLWHAIDKFAAAHGVSCSGMARQCGLDATVFNKSKRYSKFGQPRWVSLETIAKMLNKTGSTMDDFIKYFPVHDQNEKNGMER